MMRKLKSCTAIIADLDAKDREAANTKMRKQIEGSAKRLFAAV